MDRMASAAESQVASRTTAKSCGNRRWSIALTDQPSASSQILRRCLPPTFMTHPLTVSASCPQDSPRHRIELVQEFGSARFRFGDNSGVERAVRTDRARLVFPGKLPGEAHHQTFRLLGVR